MTDETWTAEAHLMEAAGIDPNDVLAEPLEFYGRFVTYREIQRDGDGNARIVSDRVVTKRRTVRVSGDALTRYRREVTRCDPMTAPDLDIDAIRAREQAFKDAGITGTEWIAKGLRLAEDVPALLDEVEQLREDAAHWEGEYDDAVKHVDRAQIAESRAEKAEAEVERLRGAHDSTLYTAREIEADLASTRTEVERLRQKGLVYERVVDDLALQLGSSHADDDCIRGEYITRAERAEAERDRLRDAVDAVRTLADSMDRDAAVILREAGDAGLSYANCTSMDARAIHAALDEHLEDS